MLRDGTINLKKLIYKKKLFNPSGILPYKFLVTNDADLIIYDGNNKILGSIINNERFEDVDFAWPEEKYFYSKTGNSGFYISGKIIYFFKWDRISSKVTDSSIFNMPAYFSDDFEGIHYLIVDTEGFLGYINYIYDGNVPGSYSFNWEPNIEVKGDGPYTLDVFNLGLVLINGKGEVYWSTLDEPVEQVNEEYQTYLKTNK